jgi:SAM-dependent methyltransferase
MHEASKALLRRVADQRFATRYFVGDGIDVGVRGDNLEGVLHAFPLISGCRHWYADAGDAAHLTSVADNSVDFVHAGHVLQRFSQPDTALGNWLRVLRPGGHLIVIVMDEDMYEQGVFPSTFDWSNRWTFTLDKPISWSPRSISLLRFLMSFSDRAQTIKVEQLDTTYNFGLSRSDQSASGISECAIEFIMRKWLPSEIDRQGRLPKAE